MFQLHPQLATDTIELGRLPLCQVLLMNDSKFPWLILVPQRPKISEIHQLTEIDQWSLQSESNALSKILMSHFAGDKMNIAALGNIVAQLHIHLVVRFKHDSLWPKPVWGNSLAKPYSDNKTHAVLQKVLQQKLTDYIAC